MYQTGLKFSLIAIVFISSLIAGCETLQWSYEHDVADLDTSGDLTVEVAVVDTGNNAGIRRIQSSQLSLSQPPILLRVRLCNNGFSPINLPFWRVDSLAGVYEYAGLVRPGFYVTYGRGDRIMTPRSKSGRLSPVGPLCLCETGCYDMQLLRSQECLETVVRVDVRELYGHGFWGPGRYEVQVFYTNRCLAYLKHRVWRGDVASNRIEVDVE